MKNIKINMNFFHRPSSSQRENLPQDVFDAELAGRNGSCLKYNLYCPMGLFDLIGIFD